jgi:dihydroorotate dehydrogenase (fumarate)
MDLSTTYMGFELPHPLVAGASPMVDNLDTVRRLEDAGAAMIVMHSLFEEQIVNEELATVSTIEGAEQSFPEAVTMFARPEYSLGPDEYLAQIGRIKQCVSVPVIASLNGTTEGGWLSYARLIQQAGADGLELNLYEPVTDLGETGAQVEERALRVVRALRESVAIPLAVKLSPFYSSIANFAWALDQAGVNALVLFNRFYQPQIDLEQLEVQRVVHLSTPAELLLRLRWLAVLSGRVKASLAATGGVHTSDDALKAVMAGAHAVQMVSALLARGPAYLKEVREGMAQWLEYHEYISLRQMQGSMSLLRCDNPKAYERANYVHILQSWEDRTPNGGTPSTDEQASIS